MQIFNPFVMPPGFIAMYGAANAPTDWVLCDGTAISRTGFAALFSVIGTTFGVGDGATTFNVPDFRQRFPIGKAAAGTGSTLGGTGGTIDHTHNAHTSTNVGILGVLSPAFTGPVTHNAQNPPFLSVNFIIKT